MYCGDASTSGNHLARRIESARGEPRDRNRWNVYCRAPSQVFLLRRAYSYFMPLLDKTFIPWPRLRSATGCRLEPELTIINLEQLEWHLFNLNYDITVFPRIQAGVPVFFHLRHINIFFVTSFNNTVSNNLLLLFIRLLVIRCELHTHTHIYFKSKFPYVIFQDHLWFLNRFSCTYFIHFISVFDN